MKLFWKIFMMCLLVPSWSPATLPTQQSLKNLLLNSHDLRPAVEKPTMVHWKERHSHNSPDKKTTTFMAVFFRRFWEKGQTHSWQATRVGNIPVCIHGPLLAALHHSESWGHGTIIRKLCTEETRMSSSSSCHRPGSSAQTQSNNTLSPLKQKLKPYSRDTRQELTCSRQLSITTALQNLSVDVSPKATNPWMALQEGWM